MGESEVMIKAGAMKEKDDSDGFLLFATTIIYYQLYLEVSNIDKNSCAGRGN